MQWLACFERMESVNWVTFLPWTPLSIVPVIILTFLIVFLLLWVLTAAIRVLNELELGWKCELLDRLSTVLRVPDVILSLGKNLVELHEFRVLLCMTPLARSLTMCPCTEPMTLLPRAVTMTAALAWPTVLSILTTFSDAAGLRPLAGLLVSRTRGRPIHVWVTVICRRLLLDSLRGQPPLPLANFMARSIRGISDPTVDWCALTILSVNVIPRYMAPPVSSPQLRNMNLTE